MSINQHLGNKINQWRKINEKKPRGYQNQESVSEMHEEQSNLNNDICLYSIKMTKFSSNIHKDIINRYTS